MSELPEGVHMSIEKFQSLAQEYAKYRPSYPEELYRFLYPIWDSRAQAQ